MSKLPYMKLWIDDFIGDTTELDATETGAYLMLLMAQWKRQGGSLPNDQAKLKRMTRCGRNWPKVWGAIKRYFETDDAGIFNERLRSEAQTSVAKVKVNSQNGVLGGKAKALKTNNQGLANATNSPKQPPPVPESDGYVAEETLVLAASAARFDMQRLDDLPRFTEETNYSEHRVLVGKLGLTDEQVIAEIKKVASKKSYKGVSSFLYFNNPLKRLAADLSEQGNVIMLEQSSAAQ